MMDSTASSSKGIIEAYFRPKKWEYIADKTIYDFMGIRLYKSIMPLSGMTEKKTYLTLADLQLYERKTRSYELRHCLGIVGTLLIALILPHSYTVFDYCFLLFLTLVFNVYPIALQRHNRIRIYRIINMLKNKNA